MKSHLKKNQEIKWGHKPPRINDILRAQELRKQNMSYREISWALLKREDPKTIHRWIHTDVKTKYAKALA